MPGYLLMVNHDNGTAETDMSEWKPAEVAAHMLPAQHVVVVQPGGTLAGHHRLHAVRAHLFEMAGDVDTALTHYREAAALTTSIPEQRYLVERAARLRANGEIGCP